MFIKVSRAIEMLLIKFLLTDKRFLILSFGMLLLAGFFWLSSRYPALDSKALMAGSLNLEDGLSFDALFANTTSFGWLQASLTTYLNWLNTNQQGMLFGLGFAILLMSLLALIMPLLTGKGGSLRSSFTGFLIGTPLGVCVNCAAPIAFGMYQKGARVEAALSTMVSSPTLNIIVLSMAFSLFPAHVVAVKILLTLLCLFVVIPLLARLFSDEIHSKIMSEPMASCEPLPVEGDITAENGMVSQAPGLWKEAIIWSLKEVGHNAWYVAKQVVPLMLLAGLLGSIAITLLPWQQLIAYLPSWGGASSLLMMIMLAGFGLFLPVPIAFDIIVSAMLLNAGVPIKYVATLLFVLGSFSIYSYLVLIRAGAKKLAHSLAAALILLGLLAGVATHFLDKYYQAYLVDQYYLTLLKDDAVRHSVPAPKVMLTSAPKAPAQIWKQLEHQPAISVLPLAKSSFDASKAWAMRQVNKAGFQMHPKTLIHHRILPFNHINSISSGDVNQDDWLDIVVGTSQGLFLYLNTGSGFQPIAMPALTSFDKPIGAIALTDMNNDGWPDLLFNVFRQGEYVAYNHQGVFQAPQLIHASDSVFALALAIGDIDHNGELDIIVGNNNGVGWRFQSPPNSKNQMLLQQDGQFSISNLAGVAGETLSILLSDINQDSYLDLLIGNDFDEPDTFYWGADDAQWLNWDKTTIAAMTETTMSLDSADFNNDLRLDTYHAQITRNPASPPRRIRQKGLDELIQEQCREDSGNLKCQELLSRKACLPFGDLAASAKLDTPNQLDCMAARVFLSGNRDEARHLGTYLKTHYPDMYRLHAEIFSQPKLAKSADGQPGESIPQVKNKNLLYVQLADKHLQEQSTELGVDITGWSWNAKFADLDGDTFQDLFIVNGWVNQRFATENVWLKNQAGKQFSNQSGQVGLDAFDSTLSYTYIDYDNDGDLDIITFSAWGDLTLYQNHNNPNHHIQIELDDSKGNRSGIGSQIVIHYGDQQALHQIREIKASGGYLSIDAPIAHFGLGEYQDIQSIDIRWSTGEKQSFKGPFQASARYRIRRP